MSYPKSMLTLIEQLKKLPSVGEKTAERYAMSIIDMDIEDVTLMSNSIIEAQKNTQRCSICNNLSESNICDICSSDKRDRKTICVVEQVTDLIAMEKTEEYHGLYHVLDGLIAPSKGVLPDDLNIDNLVSRIDEGVAEIIIATNLTIEGETTALYLINLLEKHDVDVSRIAHGLPVGGHLDYADDLTIIKAIEGRRKV